jgi:hypothetical protein
MSNPRKSLCIFYGFVGLVAHVGTWEEQHPVSLANPASRSITVDVFFLALAATTWMLLEARRLQMRGAWFYVIFGVVIAISFTFPLFLINRERTLSRLDISLPGGRRTLPSQIFLAFADWQLSFSLMRALHSCIDTVSRDGKRQGS